MSKFYPAIYIGHGKSTDGSFDSGCTWNGYTEAGLAKEVVAGIIEVFNANGKRYETDYPANDRNIVYCVRDANALGCSHYISIHLDYDKAPSGILPIVYPGSSSGIGLAEAIRASMKLRITGLNDRRNLQRADYEVANTNMPAVIMEIGSIKADNELIRNNTRLFGHAIAYGILDYAGESYTPVEENGVVVSASPAGSPENSGISQQSAGYNWDTTNIQYFLNICNYGAPEIDGVLGSETTACIKNAQRAFGIEADGIFGPVTQGHTEQQTRRYQTQLTAMGSPCGIDGVAGPGTYGSVLDFQKRAGLEVDGIVGPKTYQRLFPNEKLTETGEIRNFSVDEFSCACGCGGDVKHELKVKVQKLRDLLVQRSGGGDRPLIITSGFRCAYQNARDGGVGDSLHMSGDACDLYTPGMSRAMVDEIAYCAQQVGLGTIRYYNKLFVHVQLYPRDTIGR